MKDADRYRLHFGPYKTPRFSYGATVPDALRGDVVIVGLTNARIPWPTGRVTKRSTRGIVLFGALSKAVRKESNQAVAYWWGVTSHTVTRWRKAIGVESYTDGFRKLRSEHSKRNITKTGPAMWAKARDPARRAKLAAAKLGKPAPRHVIEAMRQANLGRKLSAAHVRTLRQPRKPSGKPRAPTRPWTKAEDKIVAAHDAAKAAKLTGRPLRSIYTRRHYLRNEGRR